MPASTETRKRNATDELAEAGLSASTSLPGWDSDYDLIRHKRGCPNETPEGIADADALRMESYTARRPRQVNADGDLVSPATLIKVVRCIDCGETDTVN